MRHNWACQPLPRCSQLVNAAAASPFASWLVPIIALAADLGYEVRSQRLTRDDIYIADEAFFTGTAAEVTPIRELDNRTIGSGSRGPVTEKLQSLFFDVVNGKVPAHVDWLTKV